MLPTLNPDHGSVANPTLLPLAVEPSDGPAEAGTSRRTRKVLHVINGEHFSGAERVQDLLAQHLGDYGYRTGFVCVKPGRFAQSRENSAPLFEWPMRSLWDRRLVRSICELVRADRYAIVHAHTPRSLLVAWQVARRCRVPLVYHVHSPVSRDSTRSFRNRVNTWVESWCLRRADRLVCVSNSLGEYMRSLGHPEDRIRVVHNGVPADPDARPRTMVPECWTLGTMALFRPRKGTEVLLRAMALLRQRGLSFRLLAVGPFETEDYERELKGLATSLEVNELIEWTGFCSNVNDRFKQMDLFVLPSLFGEGLPMVVLEAMAQGVPVVASRVEGTPEAVRDGLDGAIFEPADPRDLADKLLQLIEHPDAWQAASRRALEHQREWLSAQAMAAKTAAVYDEL